ncbi:murein biosynthesis integral membrane protein MurJ [Butyrivibrio sp. AE2032]|uniref:murein biosynthesis integral membrane protein MurJ n=1 Tax=Butyrivibrio sp. AE2032 TaxID=1458463 RepID=UPI0005545F3A|nr:lipid II flippase MurJ [Butyrivibrio sp. AE2032]
MKLNKKGAVIQLSGMMIVTLITQFLSIYKSSLIAANFGVSVEMDAYHFANNLSTFFLTFISSGITTVIIPAYIKKIDRKAIDSFITIIFSAVGFLLLLVFLFRGQLVQVLVDRDATFNNFVSDYMLLTMWIQILPAILSVTTAYYQCINHFVVPKTVLMLSNIGIIIAILMYDEFSVHQYLLLLLAGALFQFILDVSIVVKLGFRFVPTLDIHNTELKELLHIFLPTIFSTGIYKINTMVDALLSSNIGEGQLTILSYADGIVGMINTLVIGNLTVYVYPKIVERIKISQQECQRSLWLYSVAFHAVVCLIIVGFVASGREFIGILYEHGKFTSEAADAVYLCMCIYVFGQQTNIVRDLIYRYFYTNKNTKSTVKNGLITSITNITVSIILVKPFGVYGIILGTVIAGIVSVIMITIRMKNNYGFMIPMKPIITDFCKTEVCTVLGIVLVLVIKHIFPQMNIFMSFFFFGFISIVVYVLCLLLVRSSLISYVKGAKVF